LTAPEYAARHGRQRVKCERLRYRSDGLAVVAYYWGPRRADRAPRPLIVFHRGGAREDSKLRPNTQFGFQRFVDAGYIVIGTQYRGNDGGEGQDEMGGADVADVLNLIDIAKSFPQVDASRIYALGYSRGGMQALLASSRGAGFRAIATVGAPADLTQTLRANPRSAQQFARLIPGFERDPEGQLQPRSPLLWAEKIGAPLLLIAGSADPLVLAHQNSVALAARLGELRKPYELVVYEGDTHGVMINGRDRDARILAWFARH
jgi:dipeptidyl aminopeptidase/acylaminoacyl peptidase